ncbi:hypothetical protein AM500_09390 [Bacillus sp. FJAT-18017]|uniref:YqhR family membrane protein n=1 Tax=Bacillus sp. FJAT-18017 TaxID=1705566 RepID=UPI0006AFCCC6|nr:YqhR family membrane protein [Bacillus sp. FJAT-18017]ALC89964.1 hypothetical protein AM500_09390 [Bacillus sp. FJAT-18017]
METSKKYENKMSEFRMLIILTGFWGGLFWSFLGQVGYYFNFTKISPRVILEPWALGNWKTSWLGTLISMILIAVISIGVAFVYSVLLKKAKGLIPGAAFGLGVFLIIFLLLNPIFPGISPLRDLDKNTFVTSVCLFLLYGVFIGYSISWEFLNIQNNKEISE